MNETSPKLKALAGARRRLFDWASTTADAKQLDAALDALVVLAELADIEREWFELDVAYAKLRSPRWIAQEEGHL